MTSPGGSSGITAPDDSVSATGASALASNTQTNVVNRKKAEVKASSGWNSASDTLFGTLFGGFVQGITGFISFLVFALKGVTGGLIDLTGSLKATDIKADTAINTATGAAQTVVNVQKEIKQIITVFDIKSPTALWITRNPTEYPSFPWSELDMQPTDVNIPAHRHRENNQTGINAFTDNTTIGSVAVRMTRDPEAVMNATLQRFAFIRIPDDTPLTGLNFYAKGAPTDLRAKVFLMSATGDQTELTPESGNLASLLTTSNHTATPWNFDPVIVEAGSIVGIRFSCVGNITIAGKDLFDPEPPPGFYPAQLGATTALASGTAAPASIAESELTWTGFVPWVAIGNNIVVVQPKRFFEDNFDRDDSGGLFGIGGSWSISGNVGIRSNDLAFISGTDGLGYALYTRPLTTDYQLHGCRVGLLPDPAQSQVSFAALLFRCTQNRSTGLRVAFRRGAIILQSIANQTNFTNLVSTSRTLAVGDSIQAQQGEWVDEPSGPVFYPDRVLVFHNGIEIIRTDVTAATVPYGPQRRYGGLGQERTPFQNSPRIQDWFESDISEVEPAA